jgi:ribosomal protein S21
MAINVAVTKNNNENSASVLRRFTKKVRGAGFLQEVRDKRYYSRANSKLRTKNSKMVGIARSAKRKVDLKLGLIQENEKRS